MVFHRCVHRMVSHRCMHAMVSHRCVQAMVSRRCVQDLGAKRSACNHRRADALLHDGHLSRRQQGIPSRGEGHLCAGREASQWTHPSNSKGTVLRLLCRRPLGQTMPLHGSVARNHLLHPLLLDPLLLVWQEWVLCRMTNSGPLAGLKAHMICCTWMSRPKAARPNQSAQPDSQWWQLRTGAMPARHRGSLAAARLPSL